MARKSGRRALVRRPGDAFYVCVFVDARRRRHRGWIGPDRIGLFLQPACLRRDQRHPRHRRYYGRLYSHRTCVGRTGSVAGGARTDAAAGGTPHAARRGCRRLSAPPAQVPSPAKPKVVPPPPPIPADVGPAALEQAPAAVRIPALEGTPMVEDSGVSLLPNGPLRAEEVGVQVTHAVSPRLNGAGHSKTAQRVAVSTAPAARRPQQPKGSMFNSLWPKAQRGALEVASGSGSADRPVASGGGAPGA